MISNPIISVAALDVELCHLVFSDLIFKRSQSINRKEPIFRDPQPFRAVERFRLVTSSRKLSKSKQNAAGIYLTSRMRVQRCVLKSGVLVTPPAFLSLICVMFLFF